MGGLAFSHHEPPLHTPRMPPYIYKCIRDGVIDILREYFTECKSQIEVPEKTDFGDVDILVHGPLSDDFDPSKTDRAVIAQNLKRVLKAEAFIVNKNDTQPIQLAILWPDITTPIDPNNGSPICGKEGKEDVADQCCQVDLHICKDFNSFRYEYFHTAHGDLWGILGREIRHVGLAVNDKGMFIRNLAIGKNKKTNVIFLSNDPATILNFLGLDHTKYFRKFATREAMFMFATECRMFWVEPDNLEENRTPPDADGIAPTLSDDKSNSKDNKRFNKRPIFKEWIEEFLPAIRATGKYPSPKVTADQIRDEAFTQFGIKDEWEKKEKEWRLAESTEVVRLKIKEMVSDTLISDPQRRAATIRSFTDIILKGAEFQGSRVEASRVLESHGTCDLEKLSDFIENNWEAVRDTAWKTQMEKAAKGMAKV